jgi:proteic killer suppression protein
VIRSFRHDGLQRFFETGSKAGIKPKHAKKLTLQLGLLNRATQPSDLAAFPNWRLHELTGDQARRWSIWVDQKWRLTFAFEGTDVVLLDYEDYH